MSESNQHDNINHPKHYTRCDCGRTIECIDAVRHCEFNIGNVIRYCLSHKHKKNIEDLKKAKWYLEAEISLLESEKEINLELGTE
jgi:hypothetical protein